MTRSRHLSSLAFMFAAALARWSWPAGAQVITATLYGVVHDGTGATEFLQHEVGLKPISLARALH